MPRGGASPSWCSMAAALASQNALARRAAAPCVHLLRHVGDSSASELITHRETERERLKPLPESPPQNLGYALNDQLRLLSPSLRTKEPRTMHEPTSYWGRQGL